MSLALLLIGIFAKLGMNVVLVINIMVHLIIWQITIGNSLWVYIGQVAEERSASIAVGLNWTVTLLLTLTTITLFQRLGNEGTFWLFAVMTLVGSTLCFFLLREIKGLKPE